MSDRLPNLDARLMAAANFVREGHAAADIGCDHGKLSAYLAGSGKCPHVYACDLRSGPLEKARHNCAPWADKITFRLGNGLQVMSPEEADEIIIAGMGAQTILEILDAAPWAADEKNHLVLIPATKHSILRQGLARRGYELKEEKLCRVSGYWYTVMSVMYTGICREPDGLYCVCGKTEKQEGARVYREQQLTKVKKYRRGLLPGAEADAVDELIAQLEGEQWP